MILKWRNVEYEVGFKQVQIIPDLEEQSRELMASDVVKSKRDIKSLRVLLRN